MYCESLKLVCEDQNPKVSNGMMFYNGSHEKRKCDLHLSIPKSRGQTKLIRNLIHAIYWPAAKTTEVMQQLNLRQTTP